MTNIGQRGPRAPSSPRRPIPHPASQPGSMFAYRVPMVAFRLVDPKSFDGQMKENRCSLLSSHSANTRAGGHDTGDGMEWDGMGCASAASIRVSGHPVRATRLGGIYPPAIPCLPHSLSLLRMPASAERRLEFSALTFLDALGKLRRSGQGARGPGDSPGQPASSPHLRQAATH